MQPAEQMTSKREISSGAQVRRMAVIMAAIAPQSKAPVIQTREIYQDEGHIIASKTRYQNGTTILESL